MAPEELPRERGPFSLAEFIRIWPVDPPASWPGRPNVRVCTPIYRTRDPGSRYGAMVGRGGLEPTTSYLGRKARSGAAWAGTLHQLARVNRALLPLTSGYR